MTVGQLIEKLSQFDPALPVICNGGVNENANGEEADTVELIRQYQSSDWPCPRWNVDYYPEYDDPENVYRQVVNVSA